MIYYRLYKLSYVIYLVSKPTISCCTLPIAVPMDCKRVKMKMMGSCSEKGY